MAAHSSK
jgi:hypothetical protein